MSAPTLQREAQQQFGTDGIAPLSRPSAVTRLFMAVVAWAERLNLKYARSAIRRSTTRRRFPWVARDRARMAAIRAELDRVLERQDELPGFQDISVDVRHHQPGPRLEDVLPRAASAASRQSNIRRCPDTWRLVQKIPGLKTAMFSIFEPGKHLPPHRGPYNGVLRLHLGADRAGAAREARHPRRRTRSTTGAKARRLSSTTPMSTRPGTTPRRRASCCSSISSSRCAFPANLRQLAADEPGGVHALHPRGPRQPHAPGKSSFYAEAEATRSGRPA